MPYNQFDATIALSVPLIHVSAWQQKVSSDAWQTHAQLAEAAVAQDLSARVAERYYRLLGAVALVQAARHALITSQENLRIAADRVQNGAATTFDLELSQADTARARQDVATAELSETIARRLLQSISGVVPEAEVQAVDDDLRQEPDVAHFIQQAQSSPAKKAARAATHATLSQAKIARASWYPTVTGVAQETFTNATALVGHPTYYQVMVNAAWKFDGSILGNDQASRAQARATQAQEDANSRDIDEAVFQAHAQVHAGIKKAQAARDQDQAAQRAVDIARMQYQAGVITQTEVLAAQQAAFMAQVGRIQAITDLAYARTVLRILSSENWSAEVP
jgi:outer membrane protein TolC